MPDRWIAVLRAGGARRFRSPGSDIAGRSRSVPTRTLPVAKPRPTDQLAIDAGMKWMIDFDEAEAKGMALRITVLARRV